MVSQGIRDGGGKQECQRRDRCGQEESRRMEELSKISRGLRDGGGKQECQRRDRCGQEESRRMEVHKGRRLLRSISFLPTWGRRDMRDGERIQRDSWNPGDGGGQQCLEEYKGRRCWHRMTGIEPHRNLRPQTVILMKLNYTANQVV